MEKTLKIVYMSVSIMIGCVFLSCLCINLPLESSNHIDSMIKTILFLGTVWLFLTGLYYYLIGFHWCYTNLEIKKYWWRWNVGSRKYNEIKSITIVGAVYGSVYGATIPVRDQYKRQKAIISLYTSEVYGWHIRSNEVCYIHMLEKSNICRSFLNMKDLEMILKNTDADITVTEEMYAIYKEDLWDIFTLYADRILISSNYDNFAGYKRIPFKDLSSNLMTECSDKSE